MKFAKAIRLQKPFYEFLKIVIINYAKMVHMYAVSKMNSIASSLNNR